MSNNNSIISKYDNYQSEHADVPGSGNIIGILENESIETVFRVFGGTIRRYPKTSMV